MNGYLLRETRAWERLFLISAAVLLIKPGFVTDAIGAALLAAVLARQKLAARREAVITRQAK
ncbi:MAG TPA: FxsA family protein [Burkholderiales bacterium]|nr:FxsA family protein [Burkholderiales bacterium]